MFLKIEIKNLEILHRYFSFLTVRCEGRTK